MRRQSGLVSQLLSKDPKLQACLTSDPAHIFEGAAGDHVSRIQTALEVLACSAIDKRELAAKRYGPSTASAVLNFKTQRNIVNKSYQTKPDNIVGRMTIAALDRELCKKEASLGTPQKPYCGNDPDCASGAVPGAAGRRHSLLLAAAVGAAQSPAALASARIDDATDWVTQTRNTLEFVLNFWPGGPMGSRDKIWRHFGMPDKFPFIGPFTLINSLLDFVIEIRTVFDKVKQKLEATSIVLRNADPPWFPEPTTPAFTIDDDRDPRDPPKTAQWPNGIYFQPQFLPLGAKKQTEVVVHEFVHSLSMNHFADQAKPGTMVYRGVGSAVLLGNAWSYSTFVLDCVFNKSRPLDPSE